MASHGSLKAFLRIRIYIKLETAKMYFFSFANFWKKNLVKPRKYFGSHSGHSVGKGGGGVFM